ncbi:serine/threonine-protein kinase [Clostridium sp. LBM24168]|uniref:serine/threonine-protein kinase n=1 Tax=Clostridium tyrobutyricum TaxID=1519 RepID=UPI00189D0AE3|nr:serine/threonine-protein kinase [Clostridium tyrobutyricum]
MKYTKTNLDFEFIKPIGNNEGKNSEVFLAKDVQLDAELVVKKIKISAFKNIDEYFLEAKMLYDNKHPNIMEIQWASKDDNFIYLSMPFLKKGSLNSLIDKRYLSVREIIKYSLDLLSGVAYIHSKGLIHLDIKPTNILLDQSNRAILTDFGLSRYLDKNGIADQPCNYIPHIDPEWFLNSGRTVLSDIYQIGLTLYRLCNGNSILKQQLSQLNVVSNDKLKEVILSEKYPDRSYFLPHIPVKLRKIIKKALDIDTNKRYNNVIEMMNDLSEIDENLDWQFTNKPNKLYCLHKGNNNISISTKNVNDKVDIVCTKTNLTSGKITKMNNYCSEGYNTDKSVQKEIATIIKKNN